MFDKHVYLCPYACVCSVCMCDYVHFRSFVLTYVPVMCIRFRMCTFIACICIHSSFRGYDFDSHVQSHVQTQIMS